MLKKFLRFVINTKDHPRGEKIKALNIITKEFDDQGAFIEIKKPYICAQANQVELDIADIDYKKFLPLHHFKYDGTAIVKKPQAEIDALEATRTQEKLQIKVIQDQKTADMTNAKAILADITKTDKEKLGAITDIINLKF